MTDETHLARARRHNALGFSNGAIAAILAHLEQQADTITDVAFCVCATSKGFVEGQPYCAHCGKAVDPTQPAPPAQETGCAHIVWLPSGVVVPGAYHLNCLQCRQRIVVNVPEVSS